MKGERVKKILSPVRKLIVVKDAETAYRRLGDFIDSKLDRGYRLRVIQDHEANTVELSHYQQLNVDMGIRYLKECKQYVREIPWKLHKILHKNHYR